MDISVIIGLVVALLSLLCSGGACILFFLMILGFILLRRRGKKKVSAKEAVSAGVESVSGVFVRTSGGLKAVDEDEADE